MSVESEINLKKIQGVSKEVKPRVNEERNDIIVYEERSGGQMTDHKERTTSKNAGYKDDTQGEKPEQQSTLCAE